MKTVILFSLIAISQASFGNTLSCWPLSVTQNANSLIFSYNKSSGTNLGESFPSEFSENNAQIIQENCLGSLVIPKFCSFTLKREYQIGGWEYENTSITGLLKLEKAISESSSLYFGKAVVMHEGYINMLGSQNSSGYEERIVCKVR